MDSTVAIIFTVSGLLIYMLPSIVAVGNNRMNTGAICLLNIFLGWTLIGWVGALVWASTKAPKPKEANS